MSDVDLDKLTNQEIRLKCIEFGFPNVPVTDSSRKILLKRLRDAINNAATKDTATKASNRRETINITKTAPAKIEVDLPKNRRTIGPTTIISSKEDTTTGIPIATRRRSVQKEQTEPIKATKSVQKDLPTVIIEDDDDDDLALMNAADNAERESIASSVPIENIPSRRKSRSVSRGPEVISVPVPTTKKRAMTPLIEEKVEKPQKETTLKSISSSKAQNVEILSVQSIPSVDYQIRMSQPLPKKHVEPPTLGRISMQSTQNLTPSLYSTPPPTMRYSSVGLSGDNTTGYVGNTLSSYRTKYTTESILNEISDTDTQNDDDGCKSPFLSSFARDLERRRSVGRSSIATSPYIRRSGGGGSGSNYESGIRGRRSSKADVSFGQLAFYRKYLKIIFFILAFLSISIFSYIYLTTKN